MLKALSLLFNCIEFIRKGQRQLNKEAKRISFESR